MLAQMIRKLTATVTWPVSVSTLHRLLASSLRRASAISNASAAPTAPASVAVNSPPYSPPSTATIITTLGSSFSSMLPQGISCQRIHGPGLRVGEHHARAEVRQRDDAQPHRPAPAAARARCRR